MKLAVTYDPKNGEIFQHFGRTEYFKVYDLADGKVQKTEICSTQGQGHGALVGVLQQLGAETVICGGIGGGAQAALAAAGIQLFGGVSGDADEAVRCFVSGNLNYNPEVRCSHHAHEHSCGEHHCGENKNGCSVH